MKSSFHRRYLMSFLQSSQDKTGFTLIELLVVIIIISILVTIALPSFVRQSNRARATEGNLNVASINRGQALHYQQQLRFAVNLSALDVNIVPKYYNYAIDNPTATYAGVQTTTQWNEIKAVSGAISTLNGTMKSIVCVSDVEMGLGVSSVVPSDVVPALLSCPAAYKELGN